MIDFAALGRILAAMRSPQNSRATIRFDAFELDLHTGELRKQGVKIKLQGQPFQILQALLERPGEVVTRDELQKRIWPSDTFVDFEQGLNNAVQRIRQALGDTVDTPRFVETLPRKGYRFIGAVEAMSSRIKSLAVLPLENLARDPEQEYFAEGITEALINTLAKIGALRVVSRTSVMQYKGVRKSLPEIARELNVDGIIEGTVQRTGARLRVSAQLLDASTDTHIWAESYDSELRDVLALQSELAQAIAQEIQIRLTPREQAHIAHVGAIDPHAYEAYLKGRYFWNRRAKEGFQKAAQHFQEAISKDPGFAAAYAGLADCLSGLSLWGFLSPDEGSGKAKALALQALELDPGLAEAHVSVAMVRTCYDFDFAAAEATFERALELNPRYATAHSWFGHFLAAMGRHEEAYTECLRAIRLDPLSIPIRCVFGAAHFFARRVDQAVEQFQKALELDANYSWAHALLSAGYLNNPNPELAINAAKMAVQLSPASSLYLGDLAEAYAVSGQREKAQQLLDRLHKLAKHQYVTPYLLARTYVALGQQHEALSLLETGFRDHSPLMLWINSDFRLDPLRSEPRFQELIHRMNFRSASGY
jgi:TolB-like protein/Flp pilus assembly protein TadD